MRVTTLKASSARLSGLLAYYGGMADDAARSVSGGGAADYYLVGGEPAGVWVGSGRHGLGLGGVVVGDDLRALLEARHPVGGAALGRPFGDRSARGFDATFSAPKSVSVLWALTPDEAVRAQVVAAHDAAVTVALGWFESHGAVTRRGRDGVFQVDTDGICAAVFRHHTSRAADPQLHSHAVISAKVQDATGRWLALDARFLKQQQRSISAVYDAVLRAELTARVGVGWVERRPGVFDLAAVPEGLREVFSKRAGQVDVKLAELIGRWSAEHDGVDPDPRTVAQLERAAVVSSRAAKTPAGDAATLHEGWTSEAVDAGFNPNELAARQLAGVPADPPAADEGLVVEALARVAAESASWLRADIARHLATLVHPTAVTDGAGLVAEIDRLAALAEARCVPLGPDRVGPCRRDGRPITEAVTDRRLTTSVVLDQEIDLQRWATISIGPVEPSHDPQGVAAAAIAGHDRLVLVVGPAGTGKTHTTARAVSTLRSQGRPVVGLAPSGKAADVLAVEAGCTAETLAGFLTRHRHQPTRWPAGTTVIVDEAAMAATDDLAELVALAEAHRWRLVAVGDPDQLPAVGRGGVFAHWCHMLPHHQLLEPRRFTNEWEAAASIQLRAGNLAAVSAHVEHGRVSVAHPALVATQIARTHRRHTDAGRTVAITTTNAETARAVNREIQRLAGRHPARGLPLRDGTTAQAGDVVATRRNDPTLATTDGVGVRNRHTWTVTATHPDGALDVTHPDRGDVLLPADYVAEHVELGWAVTGYGNQGDTVDVGIAVLDATASRNHTYVAMTRGRHTNHAVFVDPTGLDDPAELLERVIARPASADSALATRTRLHHAAGQDPPAIDADPPAVVHPEAVELMRRLYALRHDDPGHELPGR